MRSPEGRGLPALLCWSVLSFHAAILSLNKIANPEVGTWGGTGRGGHGGMGVRTPTDGSVPLRTPLQPGGSNLSVPPYPQKFFCIPQTPIHAQLWVQGIQNVPLQGPFIACARLGCPCLHSRRVLTNVAFVILLAASVFTYALRGTPPVPPQVPTSEPTNRLKFNCTIKM
jgi:hypothetical protein